MAKGTCIQHPDSQYYLTLRRHIINMFSGDHCSAALLSFFEFATNGEIARMDRCNQTGEPWITATMPSIYNDTVGLYSIRSLQERIGWLAQLGLIREVSLPGKIARYLFDVARVNKAISSTEVFRFDPGKIAAPNFNTAEPPDPSKTIGKTIGKIAGVGGVLDLKEEELRTEELIPLIPFSQKTAIPEPTPSDSAKQVQEPIPPAPLPEAAPRQPETFTPVDLGPKGTLKTMTLRLKTKMKFGADPQGDVGRILARLGQDVSEQTVLAAMEAFLAETDQSNRYNRAAGFPRFLSDWLANEPRKIQTARVAASPVQFSEPKPTPDTPKSPEWPVMAELPIWVERWNAAGLPPVAYWNGRSPKAKLAEAESEKEFVDGFEAILRHCKAMNAVGRFKVPDFNWLFITSKDKQINWYRLLHGEFEFAENKAETANGKPKTAMEKIMDGIAARKASVKSGEATT